VVVSVLFFCPGILTLQTNVTDEFLQTLPRIVIDVQGSVTTEYQTKFLSAVPFLEVVVASPSSSGPRFSLSDCLDPAISTGVVMLYVENPLVANSTVANSIEINIYVQGGSDMNFAIPDFPYYTNQSNPLPQHKKIPASKVRAQMISDKVPTNTNKVTGDTSSEHQMTAGKIDARKNKIKAQKVVGDFSGVSCRAYTRLPSIIYDGTIPSDNTMLLDPGFVDPFNETILLSKAHRVLRLFAFQRGGDVWWIIPRTVGPNNNETFFCQMTFTDNPTPQSNPTFTTGYDPMAQGFNQEIAREVTPFIGLALPFYQPTQLMAVVTDEQAAFRPLLAFEYVNPGQNLTVTVYYHFGDDKDFGYLIEPPNLTLYETP